MCVKQAVLCFDGAVLCFIRLQVAASVEDQLAAARANIASLTAQREQRERDVDTLQDKFRQMLIIRCVWMTGALLVSVGVSCCQLLMLADVLHTQLYNHTAKPLSLGSRNLLMHSNQVVPPAL